MVKPYSEYNMDKSRKEGLQVYCKTCLSEYRKTQNKDKIREEKREYREKNKEKIQIQKKEYREKNKDVIREKKKLWKRKTRAEVKQELLSRYEKGECLTEKERKKIQYWMNQEESLKMTDDEKEQKKREATKKYKEENKERIREATKKYYEINKEIIRLKADSKKKWSVYRIDFTDQCYYIGSSNRPDLRFNKHKSLSLKSKSSENLNNQNWETANYSIIQTFDLESDCIEAEYRIILSKKDDLKCLNVKTEERRSKKYWVYVIQSEQERFDKNGKKLEGFFYVGMTTNPSRRLREHNGIYANGDFGNPNGGKYTSKHRPWVARACFGPYDSRSEALKAEYTLKRTKRGISRCKWSSNDSPLCKGLGENHPWVFNPMVWKE